MDRQKLQKKGSLPPIDTDICEDGAGYGGAAASTANDLYYEILKNADDDELPMQALED